MQAGRRPAADACSESRHGCATGEMELGAALRQSGGQGIQTWKCISRREVTLYRQQGARCEICWHSLRVQAKKGAQTM